MVLMALIATVLFGFVGLSLDVGELQWTKVRAQTAADSAVLAAVREQQKGSGINTIKDAARNDASLNGFTHSVNNTTVLINRPPTEGALAGDATAIEAVVTRNVPALLLRFIGNEATSVEARAVAKLGSGSGCIYALNKTQAATLDLGGSTSTYFSCDAVVESTNTGFKMSGSQTLYLKNNAKVGVVGSYTIAGGARVAEWPSGITKLPVRISDPGDPFASKPTPSTAGLPVVSSKANDGAFDKGRKPPGGTAIPPGFYCGGLSVGDTGGATFTMNGVYVIAGGGFKVNSSAKISGTNTTIYLTSGARSGMGGCTAAYDGFTVNGGAEVRLTAPTSGDREGMLFFQDRGVTSGPEHIFNGGSNSVLNGAIYIKNAGVTFNGNNVTGGYIIIVADTIKINGNSTINADYSTLERGSPVQSIPTLVE